MKKQTTLAAALILSLLLFAGSYGQAAKELPFRYSYEDILEEVDGKEMEEGFTTFEEVGLKMWIPEGYEDVLEEDDKEEGCIGFFMNEEGASIILTLDEAETDNAKDQVAFLQEEGLQDAELVLVNGLEAAEYTIPEDGDDGVFWCLEMITKEGELLNITIYPVTEDEEVLALLYVILSSIQAA